MTFRLLDDEPLIEALPYGVAVLGSDQLVTAANQRARQLLPATVDGSPPCHELFACQGSGEPCENGCLGLRTAHSRTLLPEVRVNVPDPVGSALWITYAPLQAQFGAVLHLRPGVANDRRRRSEPHWISGAQLRIHALGRTVVESGCSELNGQWLGERPGQVLKFLVSRRHNAVPADEIADAIWPDRGASALNSTRHAVHRLRSMLEPDRAMRTNSSFILGVRGGYRLDPRRIWIDVDVFEKSVEDGLAAMRALDLPLAMEHLQRGIDLYGGDFLADEPYADWARDERSSLHGLAARAVRALAVLARECGDAEGALEHLRRLCELEPYDDRAHREYVTVLLAAGSLGDARRCYMAFAQRMQRDFGVAPSFDLKSATLSAPDEAT